MDSGAYTGYVIPPFYDSLIAKLIVSGSTREEALNRLSRALSEFLIEGPKTTLPLGQAIVNDALFRRGKYNTAFLDSFIREGWAAVEPPAQHGGEQ